LRIRSPVPCQIFKTPISAGARSIAPQGKLKIRAERCSALQAWQAFADAFTSPRHHNNRNAFPITIKSENPIAAAQKVGLKAHHQR
jgi:hypothetical protein